jgi:hypothetical protein
MFLKSWITTIPIEECKRRIVSLRNFSDRRFIRLVAPILYGEIKGDDFRVSFGWGSGIKGQFVADGKYTQIQIHAPRPTWLSLTVILFVINAYFLFSSRSYFATLILLLGIGGVIQGDRGQFKAAYGELLKLIPPDFTCTHCGYDLRNLTSDRCPECGKPWVRPAEPEESKKAETTTPPTTPTV